MLSPINNSIVRFDHHQYTINLQHEEACKHHKLRQFGCISTLDTLPDQLTAFLPGSSCGKSPLMQLFMDVELL